MRVGAEQGPQAADIYMFMEIMHVARSFPRYEFIYHWKQPQKQCVVLTEAPRTLLEVSRLGNPVQDGLIPNGMLFPVPHQVASRSQG